MASNLCKRAKVVHFPTSYFRFVQYLRPMEADKVLHTFKPNSKFEDALTLYNFDTQLRRLMFEAIQEIEIALRTKVNHEFSMQHGAYHAHVLHQLLHFP